MSISLLDTESRACGFYKYGRSRDGSKFFCYHGKCKNSSSKHDSVTKQNFINHAQKIHLIDIDFQIKRGQMIRKKLPCDSCDKSFSRKQTLVNHKKKYHPNLTLSMTNAGILKNKKNTDIHSTMETPAMSKQDSTMDFQAGNKNGVLQIDNTRFVPTTRTQTTTNQNTTVHFLTTSNINGDFQNHNTTISSSSPIAINRDTSINYPSTSNDDVFQIANAGILPTTHTATTTYQDSRNDFHAASNIHNIGLMPATTQPTNIDQNFLTPTNHDVLQMNNTNTSFPNNLQTLGHNQMTTITVNTNNTFDTIDDIDIQDLLKKC